MSGLPSDTQQQVQRYFHGKEGYNCAQAVLKIMQKSGMSVPSEDVEAMSRCGGGRAPEGLCGALYAALEITPPERRAELGAAFEQAVGSRYCREIRRGKMAPCRDCVACAVDILSTAVMPQIV
ncbi:MAG: C-GCAxxG-C-C family (seleno)protein [Candidatus Omnitrophota bacterium]